MRRCFIGCGRIVATMLLAAVGAQAICRNLRSRSIRHRKKFWKVAKKSSPSQTFDRCIHSGLAEKDGQMYAELPRGFAQKKYFIATTVASGETYAGLQAGDVYVYWRQYDKHLALMTPEIEYRAIGDKEAESSVKRLFTDRVLWKFRS